MRHLWIGLIVTLSACDDGGNKGKATCPDGFLDAGDGACEPDDAVTVTTDGQGTASGTYGGGSTFAHIERVAVDHDAALEAHNIVRAAKGLTPFTHDDRLAEASEMWSVKLADEGCDLIHSDGSWGENLYWTSGTATSAQPVESWASEEAFYDYEINTCTPGEQCGHYTQIVWDSTQRVGCGAAKCAGGGGEVWTCRYDPPGNWVGEWPY